MAKSRYIMIGGFLGAGKTTAILKLGEHLGAKGLRVGLITNDQSIDLVDTARARAAGFNVQEITGGCFCCKFDSLVEASKTLTQETAPDALLAEPVGSCTDLMATVGYPLQNLYGGDYVISPLSVLVDPHRCAGVLGLRTDKRFSEKVIYVYRKQLEEADIIVVNKVDVLDGAEREKLVSALRRDFPKADVMEASCKSGEGLEAWFARVLSSQLGQKPTMEVDYDEYAEGEALLGWFNGRGRITADAEFDGNAFLIDLAHRLNAKLSALGHEIAHLKMTLGADEGPDLASVSLTRNDESPQATHRLDAPLRAGDLMVNLRAEADPAELRRHVLADLMSLPGAQFELRHVAAFRPGRPTPTHRVQVPAGSDLQKEMS